MKKLIWVAAGAYVLRWAQKHLLGRKAARSRPERRTGSSATYAGVERRSGV